MTSLDIARQRLHNQRLASAAFERPEDVVQWLGAVQSQDYAGAKWAVAQRTASITDADMDRAFADGAILRTHVMRPTWHFVAPADIRWMLKLTAPRVHAKDAFRRRQLELDDGTFAKSHALFPNALQGGKQLTRQELEKVLEDGGIATTGQRLVHLLMHAELEGLICSGARRDRQFTYALLDERAPQARTLEHDEALAELAKRYFTSHGPATIEDYVWWSGLTVKDAKSGIEMAKPQLEYEIRGNITYWKSANIQNGEHRSPSLYLLPAFDEYSVGYKDRSAALDPKYAEKIATRGGMLNPIIVIDGQVAGTWKRTFKKNIVVIDANPFTPLNKAEARALAAAADRYGRFMNMPVALS